MLLSPGLLAVNALHTGAQYHRHILACRRDRRVRASFQRLALALLPVRADVLDLGAGTGIDAKAYSARGHRTFVHEPSPSMLGYLAQYCRDEIANGTIVSVAAPGQCRAHAVTADFAVLNHIADHAPLFAELARVVERGGFVLASMLSPYYLGDGRYGWWWANFANLVRDGRYPSPGASGIQRFSPRAVARAAEPHFRLERLVPRGPALAVRLYMFLLLRRT